MESFETAMIRFMQRCVIKPVLSFLFIFLMIFGLTILGVAYSAETDAPAEIAEDVTEGVMDIAVEGAPEIAVETTGSVIEQLDIKQPDIKQPDIKQNDGHVVFLELYTAEYCVFCPTAERHFNDILYGDHVIGLMCMVDYFDPSLTSSTLSSEASADIAPTSSRFLARPFCKEQQALYRQMMQTGSLYTPQLIVNGAYETPGHNLQKVTNAIHMAQTDPARPVALSIAVGEGDGSYNVMLPAIRPNPEQQEEKFILRLVLLKHFKEGDMTTAISPNTGRRDRPLRNVATALIEGGLWNGRETVWTVRPETDGEKGDAFLAMVQDRDSGHILAAGHYILPGE